MFLSRLRRYAPTAGQDPRENFLSTCLAELWLREPRLCREFVAKAGLDAPDPPLVVRTQVSDGSGATLDILVEGAHDFRLAVECKDRQAPDLGQIKGYRNFQGHTPVVLLAPARALKAVTADRKWDGVPRVSWQDVWATLQRATIQEPVNAWLRDEILALLADAGLAPLARLSAEQVRDWQTDRSRLARRRDQVRTAVDSLLPLRAARATEDDNDGFPTWDETGPLSQYWRSERAPEGVRLRALGLYCEVSRNKGLDWWLVIEPAAKGPGKKRLEARRWEDEGRGEWSLYLLEASPARPFGQCMAEVTQEARRALRALGLPAGQAAVNFAWRTRVGEIASIAASTERVERCLGGWENEIYERLGESLAVRFPADRVVVGRSMVSLHRDGRGRIWLWTDTSCAPLFRLALAWGAVKTNSAQQEAISNWQQSTGCHGLPPGVRIDMQQEGKRTTFLTADLSEQGIESAVQALLGALGQLLDGVPGLV